MMNIHTTQNLNSLANQQPIAKLSQTRDFRIKNLEYLQKPEEPQSADTYSSSITFGKKGPSVRDAKKVIKATKKIVGDISEKPHPVVKREDKIIESPLFNWFLSKYEYEPVIQAAAAAIICMGLRPLTIMVLPAKDKNKENNIYAASHSLASGAMGLIAAIIITAPAKQGGKFVMEVMRKNFKEDTLKKLYPHLDINSIYENKAKGIRKEVEEWLDANGNKFIGNINQIQFLPKFKQLAELSDLTYKDILKLDIDWASQKGKSFNNVILKDGSKLYDKIDMSRLGIVVKEDGFNDAQILFKDIDKEYFANVIKDAKDTNWEKLDINSVFDANGEIKDFRKWKDINGKDWKLDLDEVYVASELEEIAQSPRISGRKRFDTHKKEYKFMAYQDNGKEGEFGTKLGTEVDQKMVDVAQENEAIDKLLTWGPDIVTRIPIAAMTIALIPWTLKNIFGLEKPKKKQADSIKNAQNNEQKQDNIIKDSKNEAVAFKGKKDPEKARWYVKWLAKYYGKPIMESDRIRNIARSLSKFPGKLTEHMMSFGSLITSSVYVYRTLKNKEFDPDRKKTLALNQGFCFVIPTAAAYTVNHMLDDKLKKFEHRISNKMQYAKNMSDYTKQPVAEWYLKNKGNVKGLKILTGICVFTLIYRYITPVVVTPLANLLSGFIFDNKNKENNKNDDVKLESQNISEDNKESAQIVAMNSSEETNENNNSETAQEIAINFADKIKQSA